jgi:hypothetical protein
MTRISAEILSEKLGIPATNLSLVVAVDLDYLLYNAEETLQRGDVVLLALEYVFYGNDRGARDMSALASLYRDKGYLWRLPVFGQVEGMFREPFYKLHEGFGQEGKSADKKRKAEEAVARILNEYGDMQGHSSTPGGSRNNSLLGNQAIDFRRCVDSQDSKDAWERIAKFVAWCAANGVGLLASFPPTVFHPDYDLPESRAAQLELIHRYEGLGVTTIGAPRDFMWEGSRFHDSVYHLNEAAMIDRTEMLFPLIAPHLGRVSHGEAIHQ